MQPALRRTLSVFCAALGLLALPNVARSQLPAVPDPQALQRLFEAQQQGQQQQLTLPDQQQQQRQQPQIYQPVAPERVPPAPPSRLEALYSSRAGRALSQFGYDVLGVPTAVSAVQFGAVQDNYVLGEGDEVVVVLRGQENAVYRQRVNRDGQVVLPRLNPITAAGRSFGDFRDDVTRAVAQAYTATSAFVSLGEIRQISVLVSGEVRAPGVRILSALATPLDAILLSGGIAKTGSLRNVAVVRGNRSIAVDLYSVLTEGSLPAGISLRNGDRIYVPPLGSTVAIAGSVRRPAIYELRNGQKSIEANALIQLAGGIEIPGNYRFSVARLEPDGTTRLVPVVQNRPIAPGEVLFVDPAIDVSLERVTVAGSVRLVGSYPRSVASSVGRVIRGVDDLTADAYTPFAVIVRRDPKLNVRTLQPFSLARAMSGAADIPLQNDDMVYVFNRDEIRLLANAADREQEARIGSEASAGFSARTLPPEGANAAGAPANVLPPNGIPPNGIAPGQGAQVPGQPPQPGMPGAPPPGVAPPQGVPSAPISALPMTPGQAVGNVPPSTANVPPALGLTGQVQAGTPDLRLQAAGQQLTPATAAIAQAAQANQQLALTSRALTGGQLNPALTVEALAQRLDVSVQSLVRMAGDHIIWVLEQVRDPGAYVAGEGTTLADMIVTAGGVLRQADLSGVEVTSTQIDAQSGTSRTVRTVYKGQIGDFQRVSLQPLDVIRLRPIFSDRAAGRVTILGQVRYPGSFDITRGERLSSVLERAGGLTAQAYPFGAVFTRERAAVAEREGNIRQARAINAQLTTLNANPNQPVNRDTLAFLSSLAQQIRDEPVVGRITVTADPEVLKVKPELDLILEPGDTLYIPPRPSTVTVSGEVLNSGSFQYIAGETIDDYITLAGGVTQDADTGRIFVILPDGSAHPAAESWLTFSNSNLIPPGSTIVVPRDLRPLNLQQFLVNATQIVGQIAVTAAALAVVGR